jgi:excisionase family DNA binding protein
MGDGGRLSSAVKQSDRLSENQNLGSSARGGRARGQEGERVGGRGSPQVLVGQSPVSEHAVIRSPGLWTMTETAQWLSVPERMVRRLVAERRIPFVKVGRYVRFRPQDVQAWRDGNIHPVGLLDRRGLAI